MEALKAIPVMQRIPVASIAAWQAGERALDAGDPENGRQPFDDQRSCRRLARPPAGNRPQLLPRTAASDLGGRSAA